MRLILAISSVLLLTAAVNTHAQPLNEENRRIHDAGDSVADDQANLFHAGDRVVILGNTFADLMHLHGYWETLLRFRCAEQGLMVRNLGWAGDTLSDRARPTNFASEDQWLSDYQTDVIIVCFGMGESFAGEAGLASFGEDLRRLLKHYQQQQYNGKSTPQLILVSPIAHEDVGSRSVNVPQRNEDLHRYAGLMGEIARELSISFVDLFQPTKALLDEGGGSRLTSNGIHLTPYGYWVVGQMFAEKVCPPAKPLRLVVDAGSLQREGQGGEISRIDQQGHEWSWNVEPAGWPSLPPPTGSRVHSSLTRFLDRLAIQSLPPGKYMLTIGSEAPTVATAKQWAAGVNVTFSPRHKAMEYYRDAVNEKNLLHFHGWRSLNQVHIIGERKQSPSGLALPEEIVEWMRRALEEDERLTSISTPSRNERWLLEQE